MRSSEVETCETQFTIAIDTYQECPCIELDTGPLVNCDGTCLLYSQCYFFNCITYIFAVGLIPPS